MCTDSIGYGDCCCCCCSLLIQVYYSVACEWLVSCKVQRQKPECFYCESKHKPPTCACDTSAFLFSGLTSSPIHPLQTCSWQFIWTLACCLQQEFDLCVWTWEKSRTAAVITSGAWRFVNPFKGSDQNFSPSIPQRTASAQGDWLASLHVPLTSGPPATGLRIHLTQPFQTFLLL